MNKNKKKLYLIFIVSLLALLILGFFVYRGFNKDKIEIINPTGEKDLPANSQDDKYNFNFAQEKENVDLCLLVKDEASKNFCIQEIALKTKATSSCSIISDSQAQSNCVSRILFNEAVASSDLINCQKIEQEMLVKSCVEKIAESNEKTDCNLITDQALKGSCLSVIYYQQAKSGNKADLCNQIPEPIKRANCLSELKNIDLHSDADSDSLDFLQEIINNTDPNNPDSDGDGFTDGNELENGYNPDGEGKLAVPTPPSIIACGDIKDEQIKAVCLLELKDQSFDLFRCKELINEELRNFCAVSLATFQK